MSGDSDRYEDSQGFASSPCMMHELEADEAAAVSEPENVPGWRRAERKRQLDRRLALDSRLRLDYAGGISRHLESLLGDVDGITVSLYWPMRGEPDLRELMERIGRSGGRCALPVVTERHRPLVFRRWNPGDRLQRGFWNIPVPADTVEVVPDVVVAPVVAFDRDCYRLGYGGGYFDRTLSAMPAGRRVLGVGYSLAAIDTIYAQPHDIPMDVIVTETGVRYPARR